MGANSSQEHDRMSGRGQGSDRSHPRRALSSSSGGSLDDEDPELPTIVAYLIRSSGQIRFTSQADDGSDSSSPEDDITAPPARTPPIDKNPNVADIQKNDIHSMVMMSSGRLSDKRWLSYAKPTVPNLVAKREIGLNRQQHFTHGDRCLMVSRHLPNHSTLIQNYNHKAFCGIYSDDGNVFLSACQDQNIRVFDSSQEDFREVNCIRARDVGWSVLDTAFSPDGQYAAYSSWSDCVHLCSISDDRDVHEALMFEPGDHSFCIFSLMFSSDNKEILGGANDGHLYVFDRELNKRTLKIDAHDYDVNTVRFADGSSHILYSGGDDGLCKVWDRRTLREERPLPVGTLAGHSDGITYIDSKGDARFLISNGKDQTMKLWDVRQFSDSEGIEETKRAVSTNQWDYRWQQVPRKTARKSVLKGDSSVMTYRGHCVLHTLIRCKFSPEATTGQRYLYTGCATGSVVIIFQVEDCPDFQKMFWEGGTAVWWLNGTTEPKAHPGPGAYPDVCRVNHALGWCMEVEDCPDFQKMFWEGGTAVWWLNGTTEPKAHPGPGAYPDVCRVNHALVYDLLTGKVVRKLEGHNSCVRDVSWHPYKNTIVSTGWDGRLLQWTYSEGESEEEMPHKHRRVMMVMPPGRNRAPCRAPVRHAAKETPFPKLFD